MDERPTGNPGRKPWLTWTTAAVCVGIFANVGLRDTAPTWDLLSKWGAPSAGSIWAGAYWALVTSVFVHVALWHLAFNLYWLWILGGTLERSIGPVRWLLLFLGAAIVSSGAQLALSGSTGIGLSGVLYGFFGFMWMSRRTDPEFTRVITRQNTLLFLGWLVGCIVATALGIWRVGNAAHVAGLAFGVAAGLAAVRPSPAAPRAAMGVLLAATIVSLFWCPWSFRWVANKGYVAHARGDYRSAVSWYLKSRKFDQEPVWVTKNLALAYRALGDGPGLARAMEDLRRLAPEAARSIEQEIGSPAGAEHSGSDASGASGRP